MMNKEKKKEKLDVVDILNKKYTKNTHETYPDGHFRVIRIESTSLFRGRLYVNLLVSTGGSNNKIICLRFDEQTGKFLFQRLTNPKYGLVKTKKENGKYKSVEGNK